MGYFCDFGKSDEVKKAVDEVRRTPYTQANEAISGVIRHFIDEYKGNPKKINETIDSFTGMLDCATDGREKAYVTRDATGNVTAVESVLKPRTTD
jgi:hypothetical protein